MNIWVVCVIILLIGVNIYQAISCKKINRELRDKIKTIQINSDDKNLIASKLEDMVIILSEANKVRSEILSGLGFEFRTPLNAVIGFSDLMKNPRHQFDQMTADKYVEYSKYIHDAGTQILNTINTVIEINQMDYTDIMLDGEEIGICDFCRIMVGSVYDKMARRRISESINIDPNLSIYCDMKTLKKIFINILHNAIQFNNDEGQIIISCEELSDFVIVKIQDTGIGIAPEDLNLIFEPFYKVKRGSSGMGLGLNIAKKMVIMIGGEIIIVSELNVGTIVSIKLPKKCNY